MEKIKENIENPFKGMAYITEKGVKPEEIFNKYSIEPFKYLLTHLNEPINSFTVGRIGVGKTMVLSLFNPDYLEVIFTENSQIQERKEIIKELPKKILSIYVNIASSSILLTRFSGNLLNIEQWQRSFADYFGHILLNKLIYTFEKIRSNRNWAKSIEFKTPDLLILNKIASNFGIKVGSVISEAGKIKSWEDLKNYTNQRISSWRNAISKLGAEKFTGPSETIDLIQPILQLKNFITDSGIIPKDTRFFIVIDQYESLFTHRKIIDFRPAFNLAMYNASRGSTRIEFKIGVRPYGYRDNLSLLGSSSVLDLEKECKEIIIDDIIEDYYSKFIRNLTMKCFEKTFGPNKIKMPNEIFITLSPVEEVKIYVGKSSHLDLHLKKFFKRKDLFSKKKFNKSFLDKEIQEIVSKDFKKECKIWIETLLAIITEKFLQKNPDTKMTNEQIRTQMKIDYQKILATQVTKCDRINNECKCLDNCNEIISSSFKTKIKEIKDGALFIISSSYKYLGKLYCGYNKLRMLSSKIVLHYIELVSMIFDEYIFRNSMKIGPIPCKTQSLCVYRRSSRYFDAISDITPHGLRVKEFLRKLGVLFRIKQLESALNSPTPNYFSLDLPISDLIKNTEENDTFIELISYGYIEEEINSMKSKSDNCIYKLNSLLCPFFGLSLNHFKVPIYIKGNSLKFLKMLENPKTSVKDIEKYISFQEEGIKSHLITEYLGGNKNIPDRT